MAQENLCIDQQYLKDVLERLLNTPSPSGMTDDVVRFTCAELDKLGIHYELTRRGAIRATLPGTHYSPRRAVAAHLDTLGAMVKNLKENGRLSVVPIGHWSARFAEGAKCTIHSDDGKTFRGTILPLKASGHTYNEGIDEQPSAWDNLELRIDEVCADVDTLWNMGIRVGDFISIDPQPEFNENGFINSRHIDDKAGVASILAAAKAVKDSGQPLPLDCHLLFTISEEVGVGASHVLHGDVAEMVSVDNGTIAPLQNTCEYGATIAMQDSTGPFDRHLTKHLIDICMRKSIEFSRDVFLYYRSDSAAALEAGNDIRTALVCFALDASHGYERTHAKSLDCVARVLGEYMLSSPIFSEHENVIGEIENFPMIDNTSLEQQITKKKKL
ncbi:MAG: osmoprotectant NAGGN system M42 family peptidase [Methylocystaceae bacterium]|nr:osmoprotectant NAGGN system M42 family peptidase [Methylocystaceae bacterium]